MFIKKLDTMYYTQAWVKKLPICERKAQPNTHTITVEENVLEYIFELPVIKSLVSSARKLI